MDDVTHYKLFLIDGHENLLLIRTGKRTFKAYNKSWGFAAFIKRADVMDKTHSNLHHDTLIIGCEVKISEGNSTKKRIIPEIQVSEDFGELFVSQRFSDLVISVHHHEFRVHKAVLVTRSPVFSAMFSHQLKEEETGRIEINDIEKEVVEEMLKFIYTGKALKLYDTNWCRKYCEGLLAAAEKYNLQRLKLMCEVKLASRLSLKTAVQYLKLAFMYSAGYLKKKSISYMNANSSKIIGTEEWRNLVSTCPGAVAEAYEALSASLKHTS